ncbi:MAG TPA: glycoside hydrolase family 13 protein [Eubacteriales bacterium]|nr:glycoside hydrolase family 13 protein [Eubacteriales bacterium]
MRIYHDSRDIRYRSPQGAAPVGSEVALTVECEGDFLAFISIEDASGRRLLPMDVSGSAAKYNLHVQDLPGVIFYSFLICKDGVWKWCGADSGKGKITETEGERYRIVAYLGDFATPKAWCEGVCYQIFPDRFYRAMDDDEFLRRLEAARMKGRRVRAHLDRSEEPFITPEEGRDFYAPNDYYGGDLEGIRQKLSYLAELGVSYIYLNPIFEADSNHRYNTADYDNIDPILGGNEDFVRLAAEAKALGIAIITDGVFSHTGSDSVYFDKLDTYGGGACDSKSSKYYPWYRFMSWPDRYDCWWGFDTLPNVNELEPSYDEFICGENGILTKWMRMGGSGWRLDVADELPDEFIRHIRRRIKAEDPNALLMGEVWEDCSDKFDADGRRAYVNGDSLDCAMNYPFREGVLSFLTGKSDAYDLNDSFQRLRERYPKPFFEASLNLMSSHDEVRMASALMGAPDRHTDRALQLAFKPSAELVELGKRRFILATAIQMLYVGVPCVYYGDEAGMTGGGDPFNRRFYPWGDEDKDCLSKVKELIAIRNGSEAVRRGHMRMGALNSEVFCVIRYLERETVILLVSRSREPQRVILFPALLYEGADGSVPVEFSGSYRVGDGKVVVDAALETTLPPLSYSVYIREA